jgi:hypothetical protein
MVSEHQADHMPVKAEMGIDCTWSAREYYERLREFNTANGYHDDNNMIPPLDDIPNNETIADYWFRPVKAALEAIEDEADRQKFIADYLHL